MNIDYSQPAAPPEYHCQFCPNKSVKLWRQVGLFPPKLFCANCASHHQGENISTIDSNGGHTAERGYTYMIGNLVPAIPDEESGDFWGWLADSMPAEARTWWQCLPTT